MRTLLAVAAIALVVAVVAVAGCGNESGRVTPGRLTLTDKDFDTMVLVSPAQEVDIALAEAGGSTGFTWHCTWNPEAGLKLIKSSFKPPLPGKPTGAPGTRHFLLQVAGVGTTEVALQSGQWWNGGEQQSPHKITLTAMP